MGLLNWLKGEKPSQSSSIPIADLEITPEFKQALDLIESGASPILITGGAGTGKSALLQYFRKTTRRRVAVLAPTGMAAVNVRGVTIHSFFKFPPALIQQRSIKTRQDKTEMLRNLDTLIIDEVSMVRADLMDGVDWSLRLHTGKAEPFGGVQVVLFGDLAQLPPVVREDALKAYFQTDYDSPYFFSAAPFGRVKLHIIELTKIFRQAGDSEFAQILQRIRTNEYTIEDLTAINTRYAGEAMTAQSNSLVLTTTNKSANETNLLRMHELKSEEHVYEAKIEGTFPPDSFPAEQSLRLKDGAQVMMLKNHGSKWMNGTIGKIVSCNDENLVIELPSGVQIVEPEEWEIIDYEFNSSTMNLQEHVIGKFKQFPVRLAWAITIHKSQGQTFDSVDIDLHSGAFAHGQLYVALSRCKSLAGVRLRKLVGPQDILCDSRVFNKMREWGLVTQKNPPSSTEKPDAAQSVPVEPPQANNNNDRDAATRTMVQRAMDDGHRLELEYLDASGTSSKRVVSPLAWFGDEKFSAYCHLRKSEREFRVSRITAIRAME